MRVGICGVLVLQTSIASDPAVHHICSSRYLAIVYSEYFKCSDDVVQCAPLIRYLELPSGRFVISPHGVLTNQETACHLSLSVVFFIFILYRSVY